jgi:hypothetical protein
MRPAPHALRRTFSIGMIIAGFAVGGSAVSPIQAAFAAPAPGDNGDVKVHRTTTAVSNEMDDPKVCKFYLDAFNFDTVQQVTYSISQQPPTGHKKVLSGSLTLNGGTGHTGTLSLPNGHYKLTWKFNGEKGSAKHKVFMVSCPPVSTPPGGGGPGGTPPGAGLPGGPSGTGALPSGSVMAGHGTSTTGPSAAEIGGGAALLTAAAGVFLLRTRTRIRIQRRLDRAHTES